MSATALLTDEHQTILRVPACPERFIGAFRWPRQCLTAVRVLNEAMGLTKDEAGSINAGK